MTIEATIVIPTLCNTARADGLRRAIRSVQRASRAPVCVVLSINGAQVDEDLAASFAQWPEVRCVRNAVGSLPLARATGRRAVTTPYYGFLDDDDELLDGAIDRHLARLTGDGTIDLSVCNGLRQLGDAREPVLESIGGIDADPMGELFRRNWLASCAGLYRAATIGSEYFDDLPVYAEWTWLAFRLLMEGKRVAAIAEPGFVIHDTPVSMSKSAAYKASFVPLYQRMQGLRPPAAIAQVLRRRLCDARHDLAGEMLAEGRLGEAARLHLQSLQPPYGLRYLSYTRKLLGRALSG